MDKIELPQRLIVISALALLSSFYLSITLVNAAGSDQIFTPSSAPYGTAYKNWLAKYWTWVAGIPGSIHPLKSYSPEKCALNQQGPVWFLPGVAESKENVVRTCSIPAGKAIGFDIESGECDLGIKDLKNDQDLISCATAGNLPQFVAARLSVDGTPIHDINQYRVQSDFFNISIPKDNFFDSPAGTFRAITSGYFIILKPMSAGNHVINYADQINNPTETQYNHQKSVTYKLEVAP